MTFEENNVLKCAVFEKISQKDFCSKKILFQVEKNANFTRFKDFLFQLDNSKDHCGLFIMKQPILISYLEHKRSLI